MYKEEKVEEDGTDGEDSSGRASLGPEYKMHKIDKV